MAEGFVAPRCKDPETNRALAQLTKQLNLLLGGGGASSVRVVSTGGGSGGGSGSSGLIPRAGATVSLYVYNDVDPTSPTDLIGTVDTDETGWWSYDLASYCETEGFDRPFMVTKTIDGVVEGHKTVPDHFWLKDDGSYLPIMVEGREVVA